MHTFTSALSLIGVSVPGHLEADAEVPVVSGPQAQGDVLVFPVEVSAAARWQELARDGIQLIRGEATGNTHWLHPGFDSPGIRWVPGRFGEADPPLTDAPALLVGYLDVPDGQSALLIHTDEHGANGIGPGRYAIHRKRQAVPATGLHHTENWDYLHD